MKKILSILLTCCLATALCAQLPIIGISGTHGPDGAVRVPTAYITSVLRAGGVPVVLPVINDPEVIKKMVASLDGLILTGGEDVDPLRYREEPLPRLETINPIRDSFDVTLIRYAMERNLPIFGICRGLQIMNVAFGGTLYQDIPTQRTNVIKHRQEAPGWHGSHKVHIKENSLFARILGSTTLMSNSYHHQAIKDIAPGFVATGHTSDGVIETIEMTGNPRVFAVQFHPELQTAHGLNDHLPMFKYLVELASKR
jgi:putative glutamine amidotransferase